MRFGVIHHSIEASSAPLLLCNVAAKHGSRAAIIQMLAILAAVSWVEVV